MVAAKASTTAILQAGLSSGFTTTYPNNFKIVDGATTYQVSKLIVSTTTDASGSFTVFGQATMEAIGFDEGALKNYLLERAQSQESSSVFSSINLDYASVQANFTTGQVHFTLTGQGELEPAFSPSDFTTSIVGKSIADARDTILALSNLQDGKISVSASLALEYPVRRDQGSCCFSVNESQLTENVGSAYNLLTASNRLYSHLMNEPLS